jgi:hypothetical protein
VLANATTQILTPGQHEVRIVVFDIARVDVKELQSGSAKTGQKAVAQTGKKGALIRVSCSVLRLHFQLFRDFSLSRLGLKWSGDSKLTGVRPLIRRHSPVRLSENPDDRIGRLCSKGAAHGSPQTTKTQET